MDELALDTRTGLPDALKSLLVANPRPSWEDHPEFGPLTRFWLERHLGFRQLLDALQADTRSLVDGAMDPAEHARRLSRMGGMFLNGLHQHHSIEDHHYFPKLVRHAPGLERGFEVLDADHHRLHEEIEALAGVANAVLGGAEGGPLADRLDAMARFLNRHLTDEEDLVVPVILTIGEASI